MCLTVMHSVLSERGIYAIRNQYLRCALRARRLVSRSLCSLYYLFTFARGRKYNNESILYIVVVCLFKWNITVPISISPIIHLYHQANINYSHSWGRKKEISHDKCSKRPSSDRWHHIRNALQHEASDTQHGST